MQFNEGTIRLLIFAISFGSLLLLEKFRPRKLTTNNLGYRQLCNLVLGLLGTLCLRVFLPILASGIAILAQSYSLGFFNVLDLPSWVSFSLSIVFLDLLIYLQHRASHHYHFLWRFHLVHHTDRHIDTTTGVRFHPLEIIFSMIYKMMCVVLLGAPPLAVIVFEIILSSCSLFSHANIMFSPKLEKIMRIFIVTPQMHEIHHSVFPQQTNSNFSFCLSLWDRLFGTYIKEADKNSPLDTIGIKQYLNSPTSNLPWCLKLPFLSLNIRSKKENSQNT